MKVFRKYLICTNIALTVYTYCNSNTCYLVKVRIGFRFSHPIEVLHIYQLEVKGQAWVGDLELRELLDMRQVTKMFVAPVVKITKAGEKRTKHILLYTVSVILFLKIDSSITLFWGARPCTCTALCIQVYSWNPKAHKSGEERLLHVRVLLKRHVLDDWRQLVVVSNHDPTL